MRSTRGAPGIALRRADHLVAAGCHAQAGGDCALATAKTKNAKGHYQLAYAGLGDKESAFAALEKSYQERIGRMVWLNVDPLLDPLRSDPRFNDLVRRVGLPAQSSSREP